MATEDQLILALAGDGREEALSALIERHGPMVERTARRLLNDPQWVDDVSQAVFLVLLQKAASLTKEGSLTCWLHRTTVMCSRNFLKSERRRRRREQEAVKNMRNDQEVPQLPPGFDEALERLPAIYRHAIELRFLEGRSATEIAAILGMKASAIDMRISRGLERLRHILRASAPALTAAALMQALTAEAAQAATASATIVHASSLIALSGAKPASLLAKGALHTMFWIKVKTLVAVACATACLVAGASAVIVSAAEAKPVEKGKAIKRVGPLADLPSEPGAHIAKIKALADGEWINIGKAAADPKHGEGSLRSWGCTMPYASDLGGAFNSGQGPHGYVDARGYYDDIFFYDLYAHPWICLVPGINTNTFVDDIKKGEIKLGDKGYMVYKDGQPVYAIGHHSYQRAAYDSDQGIYGTVGWGNGTGGDMHIIGAAAAAWYNEGRKLIEEQMKGKNIAQAWPPFCYNTRTGKLSREAGCGNFYLTSKKAFWMLWGGMTMLSTVGDAHPSGPTPQVAYPNLCDFPACQDTKRDRIYIGRTNGVAHAGDFYIYDVATNAWSNPPCKGSIALMPSTNNGIVHYDSVSDRVIVMGGWCGGGKPEMNVWDPNTCAWEAPVPLKPPTGTAVGLCVTGFYCPELNAHFLQIGSDGESGEFWVYRHKNKAAAKAK
jgi:RNA polymerase sigma factor (sigma-70 family)